MSGLKRAFMGSRVAIGKFNRFWRAPAASSCHRDKGPRARVKTQSPVMAASVDSGPSAIAMNGKTAQTPVVSRRLDERPKSDQERTIAEKRTSAIGQG
jgi:hypothetical protein